MQRLGSRASVAQVSNWVSFGLGMAYEGKILRLNEIDGEALIELTDADLKSIGVNVLGRRKRLLREAERLMQ